MSKRLFVGSLAWGSTDQTLKSHFEQAGAIESAAVIMDKMSGRSKGFGFVEMASDADASTAIDKLNGSELDGRTIAVNEARPQEDRPRRDFGGDRGGRPQSNNRSW